MSGHAYSRAVRAHILAHLALANEIMKSTSQTTIESLWVKFSLLDVVLNAVEDTDFVIGKFKDTKKKLEKNGLTAKLWIHYFEMITLK